MTNVATAPTLRPSADETVDWLDAGGTVLTWVRANEATALVAGRRDGGVIKPVPEADAVLALAARASWATGGGGVVRWLDRPVELSVVGRVDAASTNDVLRVCADGVAAVLKVYRIAGTGEGEEATLTALAPTGLVPRVVGRLAHEPADGPATVLALVLEAIPGVTLDLPLRDGLEAARRRGDAVLTMADRAVLRRVRVATSALHASLAQVSHHAAHRRLADLLVDIEAVRYFAGGARAQQLLDHAATTAATLAKPTVATEPAHGDLHLSNVIVDGEQVRFIDLVGGDAGPADDFAALRRGVECMCVDVEVDRIGQQAGSSQEIGAALRQVAWTAPAGDEAALFTPFLLPGAPVRKPAWDQWCTRAATALAGPRDTGVDRLAYLARLIHDLRYHVEHQRTYYADLAWWHLARWCLASQPRTTDA